VITAHGAMSGFDVPSSHPKPSTDADLAVVGALFSAGATLAASFGDNCVKYAYNKVVRDGLDVDQWGKEWTCCEPQYATATLIWFMGWLCTIILNSVLNALSLMWAPASLVIPMSALHIVWNVGLAKAINGEETTYWVLGCTVHISPGHQLQWTNSFLCVL